MTNLTLCSFLTLQVLVCVCGALDPNLFVKDHYANYSSEIKPKKNLTQPVEIFIKLHIESVREINERFQTMSFIAWFELNWTDEFLILKDEIEAVNILLKEVWTPDVSLYNSVEDPQHISDGKYLVLFRKGRIVWYPARQYTVRCSIDIRLYPFDKQICDIRVGSWQAPVWNQVFITDSSSLDISQMAENGEWILSKTSVESNFSSEFSISWIRYVLNLQRRSTYNIINNMLPIILLSFLNTLVFRLPADSGEKITLCVSLLLSFTVFLTIFNEAMPKMSTNISYLSIYLCVQLAMSVLGIVASVELWRYKMNTERKIKFNEKQLKNKKDARKYCVSDEETKHIGSPYIVGADKDAENVFLQTVRQCPQEQSPDLNGNRLNANPDVPMWDPNDNGPIIHSYIEKMDKILFCISLTITAISTTFLLVMLLKDN